MLKKTWFKVLIGFIFAIAAYYSLSSSVLSYQEQKEIDRAQYEASLKKMEDSPLKEHVGEPLPFYPIDEKWKVEGEFISGQETSKKFSMLMTDGTSIDSKLAGKFSFQKGGVTHILLIFDEGEQFLLPFVDATSGTETYGGGRYINIDKKNLKGDRLTVDFNDAANFYCAYSPSFICPVPPRENFMSFPVAAGEKKFEAHEH